MSTLTIQGEPLPSLALMQTKEIPWATAATIGLTAKDADGEKLLVLVDEYLSNFCEPPGKDEEKFPCPRCGTELFGTLFGSFKWGICNGEGFCGRCSYPVRGIHRIYDQAEPTADDEPAITLSHVFLAYHPSVIERVSDEAEPALVP